MTQQLDQVCVVDFLRRREGGASSFLRAEVELEPEQRDCYNKSDLVGTATMVRRRTFACPLERLVGFQTAHLGMN